MNGPLLAISRYTAASLLPVRSLIQPPGSLCRTALSTRFEIIRSSSCGSPVVSAGSSFASTRRFRRSISGAAASIASSAQVARSVNSAAELALVAHGEW